MWIAGMRRRLPTAPTRRSSGREPSMQDSGAFALEHPYRGRAPEIHELVLAWLLDDNEEMPVPVPLPRPAVRPA